MTSIWNKAFKEHAIKSLKLDESFDVFMTSVNASVLDNKKADLVREMVLENTLMEAEEACEMMADSVLNVELPDDYIMVGLVNPNGVKKYGVIVNISE